MARQVLENGVILPAEYSDDWYDDMSSNLTKLDDVIGSDSEKLSSADVGAAALSNSYNDLDNLPTIPTKTSDLTNDSNFVDTSNSAVASGITSAKVTSYDSHVADTDIHVTTADKTKWNNGVSQSYVLRYSSSSVTDNSTIAYSTLDNTDNIKSGDKVIDVDGKIFSIVSVDTANQTFTIGSALIDLALDANVVHTSGNETIAGIKTFSDDTYIKSLNFTNEVASPSSYSSSILPIITTITYGDSSPSLQARLNLRITADGVKSLYPHENNQYSLGLTSRRWIDFFSYHGNFAGQQQGDEYSGNARTNLTLLANRDTVGQSGCVVDTFRENTAQGTGTHIIGFGIKENSKRYEGCRFSWSYDDDNNGYVFSLRPTKQGTNQPIKYELGNSSSKWNTINGLEPSALGMPDLANGIDISSYIIHLDKVVNLYTPTVNGWISIRVKKTSLAHTSLIIFQTDGLLRSCETGEYTISGTNLPVIANQDVKIYIYADALVEAKFYPCRGNV